MEIAQKLPQTAQGWVTVEGSGNVRRVVSAGGTELGSVCYMGTRINRWASEIYSSAVNCYFPCGNHSSLEAAVGAVVSLYKH